MSTDQVVLEARDVVKNYGGTRALKGVNFEIRSGTVTTLFGENGAGKSTLMKILSGVEQPTSGEILLGGEPVTFASTTEAAEHGISIIHQELSLAPNLTVRDNIFMGREIMRPFGGVDFAEERRQTRALLQDMKLAIEPDTLVSDLRVGQQQIIEIARALSVNSRILIMDEPTSALAAAEVETLFGIIRELLARGVAIVYISHHLEEALEITDHAVVLRDGTMTARAERADIDLAWIVRNMVGENFDLGSPPEGYEFGEPVLSVEDLTVLDPENPERAVVNGIDLEVRAGEIVCIYGLMGAGRTELLEAIAGRERVESGEIRLHDRSILGDSIAERIDKGVGLVPEDRQRDGLVQTFSVGRNLTLASLDKSMSGLAISRQEGEEPGERAHRCRDREDAGPRPQHRGTLGRQSAEGRDRQDRRDRPAPDAARRAESRNRRRGEGRGLPAARRARAPRRRRGLHDERGRRVPQHRAPHHRDEPRAGLGGVRARRHQGHDHGRLGRSLTLGRKRQ